MGQTEIYQRYIDLRFQMYIKMIRILQCLKEQWQKNK